MPVPAKKTPQYVELLNNVLEQGTRLGDIDKFNIVSHIKSIIKSDPVGALLLKAALAHVEGDIDGAIGIFEAIIKMDDENPYVHTNYARLLSGTGLSEQASVEIRKALDCCKNVNNWNPLGYLTSSAIIIHDFNVLGEIASIARRFDLKDDIYIQASVIFEMEGAKDEECVELLEAACPDEMLRGMSVEITPERWEEMNSFANSLSKYLE